MSSRRNSCEGEVRMSAEKRKGVRFADEEKSSESSLKRSATCDYLAKRGTQWKALANTFDCETVEDETSTMNELLTLCSWWDEEEATVIESPDTSCDWSEILSLPSRSETTVESNSLSNNNSQSMMCRVVSNSLIQLQHFSLLATTSTNTLETSECENDGQEAAIERAFRGIISDDNQMTIDMPEVASDDSQEDFWNDVDF